MFGQPKYEVPRIPNKRPKFVSISAAIGRYSNCLYALGEDGEVYSWHSQEGNDKNYDWFKVEP